VSDASERADEGREDTAFEDTAGNVSEEENATDHDDATGDADLAAQLELLVEENRRLREEYVRSRRIAHRRTALGLFAVGALAVLGGLALPSSRTVLFALGGTGLFGAVLTYFLTPEQFVAADTGERIYAAFAETGRELVAELGLRDDRVYAPVRTGDDSVAGVRLFVPQRGDYVVPDPEKLDSLFVVTDDEFGRGVALPPTGGALYREFASAMTTEVADRPGPLGEQLADALVEGFELAESARPDVDPDDGRLTVELSGLVYGAADRFDHPAASFLAVGVAAELGAAVTTTVRAGERKGKNEDWEEIENRSDEGKEQRESNNGNRERRTGSTDALVTCEWNPDAVGVPAAEETEP